MPSVSLVPAEDQDRDYVTRLLEAHDLPVADLDAAIDHLRIGIEDGRRTGVDGGRRIGVGGVVPYGEDGLLRSVVIAPGRRGEGYGSALIGALEDDARERGIDRLYLLTTTAGAFFEGLEYTEVPRTDAPPAVRESAEFDSLCPASATCMQKSLVGE